MLGRIPLIRNNSRARAWRLALLLVLGLSLTVVVGQAHSAEPAGLLPNLVADPPDNQSLETSNTEGGLKPDGESRLLLRFNGYIHNTGPGALDIRGSREKPAESKATEEEVERHREKEEGLPQNVEEQLANPPMKVFQRVFTTSAEETNIERPHKEETSPAEVFYVNADGHHHWHLQHVAKYSLWNATKTAEVAPAQKVGFCLDDSQHVETGIGPSKQVYADAVAPFRDFCQQFRPNATSLFEGVSPGWRDVYTSDLGFQWVEVSNVLPGEYWLREDVNPTGVIKETGGANVPSYATTPTIIPGFVAQAQTVSVQAGESKTVTVTSKAFKDTATPKYALVASPQHGKLTILSSSSVSYTPTAGYTGPDSFTFSAADPNSRFPLNPAVATVSIEVGAGTAQPSVSIEGAPASIVAGSSVQLKAAVKNDIPEVTWSTSAGSITSAGVYTAPSEPPAGGKATVTATTSKGAQAKVSIEITAASPSNLLVGDATATYPVAEGTPAGRAEAFGFTAKATGTVEELQFRTNGTADPGITGVDLGIFAEVVSEGVGIPGKLLGQAKAPGEPATNSWIKATGLSVPVVSGTKYFLEALPLGANELHFNTAVASGGVISGNSKEGSLTELKEFPTVGMWEGFFQGPVGFQALAGTAQPQPSVSIEGAPASMVAGSSVQLTAVVKNDSPEVTWSTSAGSITSLGVYTAPTEPPAGGKATVTATTVKGAQAKVSIEITSVAQPSVSIEGAPASMAAGANVQLTAVVKNDSPEVTWSTSAGSITSAGVYTAPAEPPAGGKATVTATTAKGAQAKVSIEITAAAGSKGLLVGDATTSYSVADVTTAGREEAFQFTAKSTGTVEELQFRTSATANTGLTGVILGVFAESSGKPGAILGQAKVSGEPAVNSWIKATGVSAAVVSGTKYWLVVLPLGSSSAKLHYNVQSASSAGTGNLESSATVSVLTAESSWVTYNQGSVGFQAIGATSGAAAVPAAVGAPQASVAIAGAQSSMIAGVSVQLSATVTHDSTPVSWSASAGTITKGGLYTAPSVPPAGGTVTITAGASGGAHDQRTVAITPPPPDTAAPAAPLPAGEPATAPTAHGSVPVLPRPEAMLMEHTLVMTTGTTAAGRIELSAYLGKRRLGGCAAQSPVGRSFSCRLTLGKRVSRNTPVRVVASLRVGAAVLRNSRPAEPLPAMKMGGAIGAGVILANGQLPASWRFNCSPSMARALAAALRAKS
jgi:hypothetical protein